MVSGIECLAKETDWTVEQFMRNGYRIQHPNKEQLLSYYQTILSRFFGDSFGVMGLVRISVSNPTMSR